MGKAKKEGLSGMLKVETLKQSSLEFKMLRSLLSYRFISPENIYRNDYMFDSDLLPFDEFSHILPQDIKKQKLFSSIYENVWDEFSGGYKRIVSFLLYNRIQITRNIIYGRPLFENTKVYK